MDAGAQGVLAPYCETVEQVREVVAAAKWRPLKGEAVDRVVGTGEHISDATRAYLEDRNKNSIAIIGIESVAAVDNLEAILEVPGIDGIFVGPNDMSISLGYPDQYDRAEYRDTVKRVIDMSDARGIATLVHHQTPDLSTYWIEQGARFVLHGTDRRALTEACGPTSPSCGKPPGRSANCMFGVSCDGRRSHRLEQRKQLPPTLRTQGGRLSLASFSQLPSQRSRRDST